MVLMEQNNKLHHCSPKKENEHLDVLQKKIN